MRSGDAKFHGIIGLAREMHALEQRAAHEYKAVVDNLVLTQSRDIRSIEQTLDRLLDFCGHESVLALFKKLCRYYWSIDPAATADYINAYREYWDSDETAGGS